jgi:hypothetical protein
MKPPNLKLNNLIKIREIRGKKNFMNYRKA